MVMEEPADEQFELRPQCNEALRRRADLVEHVLDAGGEAAAALGELIGRVAVGKRPSRAAPRGVW